MNIAKIIKSNKQLRDLPFLVVFLTIKILNEMGMLKEFDDVDTVQP